MEQWPPHVIDEIHRQLSQFGRIGSTKTYATPAIGQAVPISSSLQAPPLQFREPGIVIAMYGQELTGTAAKFASTTVRVQIGGQEDLFTDGNVGVGLSMLALFGGSQNWYPMWRRAVPGVNWVITYGNLDAAAVANPSTYFAFLADSDIARYAK